MPLLFVYGTLRSGLPNGHFMDKYTLVSKATTVEKFPMVITSPFNIPFVLNEPGYGFYIRGEVYDVESDITALDKFENVPMVYSREAIQVILDSGVKESAFIYILENYRPELLNLQMIADYETECYRSYVSPAGRSTSHEQVVNSIVSSVKLEQPLKS